MKVSNLSIGQLQEALYQVNQEYNYHLEFNRQPEQRGKWIHFTIQSHRSGIPGSRVSWTGRAMKSASWHSHGYLFEAILDIEPEAVIKTATSEITQHGGNWKDWNIGSIINPVSASEVSIL